MLGYLVLLLVLVVLGGAAWLDERLNNPKDPEPTDPGPSTVIVINVLPHSCPRVTSAESVIIEGRSWDG